ncbi:MAG: pentapeptide repeat-containing protein [Desulfomonilaceae bacterium]
MPQCKHYEICGLDADPGEDCCILHSHDPEKDRNAFAEALAVHREKREGSYSHFVFPAPVDFSGVTLTKVANFSDATFTQGAKFCGTEFKARAIFMNATFAATADFSRAKFTQGANFLFTEFTEANFEFATLAEEAHFLDTKFRKQANFFYAAFTQGAEFVNVSFTEKARFFHAKFQGSTSFDGLEKLGDATQIFSGIEVDFRRVTIEPLDALVFRNADVQKCRFLYTDLRKAEFTDVKWPEIEGPSALYDQDETLYKGKPLWSLIEQLYRQLKQNYEDRHDYERARHFHYGEKEMRRKNSGWGLSILLTVYRWVSGYGESCLLPLFWATVLLAATTAAYFCGGLLVLNKDANSMLSLTRIGDVGLYSLRVMTLLKPNDFIPTWFCGNFVNWIQSIFGPLLFGFFALALRQRLKR